jgi:hypothetical protein
MHKAGLIQLRCFFYNVIKLHFTFLTIQALDFTQVDHDYHLIFSLLLHY